MRPEQVHYLGFTPVEIPRNERYCGVKIVLVHVLQQTLVVDESVRFLKPCIVDREVCVMPGAVPGSVSRCLAQEHHVTGDGGKNGLFSKRIRTRWRAKVRVGG